MNWLERQLSLTPLDKLFDALLESGRRFITKEFTCFRHVCPSLRHVPRLLRQAINDGLLTHDLFDGRNHFAERDCLVVTQIDDFVVGSLIMEGAEDAFNDVWDRRRGQSTFS